MDWENSMGDKELNEVIEKEEKDLQGECTCEHCCQEVVEAEKTAEAVETSEAVETVEAEEPEADEEKACSNGKVVKFTDRLIMYFVDASVNAAIAVALMYIVEFVMKYTVGLYFKDKAASTLMFFVITSVFVPAILEKSKLGNTIGKKVCDLQTVKIK